MELLTDDLYTVILLELSDIDVYSLKPVSSSVREITKQVESKNTYWHRRFVLFVGVVTYSPIYNWYHVYVAYTSTKCCRYPVDAIRLCAKEQLPWPKGVRCIDEEDSNILALEYTETVLAILNSTNEHHISDNTLTDIAYLWAINNKGEALSHIYDKRADWGAVCTNLLLDNNIEMLYTVLQEVRPDEPGIYTLDEYTIRFAVKNGYVEGLSLCYDNNLISEREEMLLVQLGVEHKSMEVLNLLCLEIYTDFPPEATMRAIFQCTDYDIVTRAFEIMNVSCLLFRSVETGSIDAVNMILDLYWNIEDPDDALDRARELGYTEIAERIHSYYDMD